MNISLYTFAKAMKCTTRMNPKVYLTLNDHDVGSSFVKKQCTILVKELVVGKAMHVQGQGAYWKSLYLPLNFAVDLKLLSKIKSQKFKKKNSYFSNKVVDVPVSSNKFTELPTMCKCYSFVW